MGCKIEKEFNSIMLFDIGGDISLVHFLFMIKKMGKSLKHKTF